MNNQHSIDVFRSSYPTNPNQVMDSSPQGNFLEAFAIPLAIGGVILILWIWSMVSMVMLNARFKDFYKEYQRSEKQILPSSRDGREKEIKTSSTPGWLAKRPSLLSVIILIILIIIFVSIATLLFNNR